MKHYFCASVIAVMVEIFLTGVTMFFAALLFLIECVLLD